MNKTKAQIECEVIPVWYIDTWKKLNCAEGSALDFFIKQLIKEHVLSNISSLNCIKRIKN